MNDGAIEEEKTTHSGTVKFFKDHRGFGFIADDHDNRDYFVLWRHIHNPFKSLDSGDRVTYQLAINPKGGLWAIDVKKI